MKWLVILFALVTYTVASESHSLEKRQTTVTFTSTYEDIRSLITNIVLAITFATVMVVVIAPIFGYKLDLLVSSLDDFAPASELTGTGASAYTAPEVDSYGAPATNYAAPAADYGAPAADYRRNGRSMKSPSLWETGAIVLNSIDMVDTTFNVMEVDTDVCRKRAVCEVESVAARNPLFSLVVNTVNSRLRGLERYSEAVEAGLGGEDCALVYDECPHSFVDRLNFF